MVAHRRQGGSVMTLRLLVCLLTLTGAGAASAHRIAVVVARNDGGVDRPVLRYAHSDAILFADMLIDVGGVARDDVRLVLEADRGAFFDALAAAGSRARVAVAAHERVELVVYYSGHSDVDGVILGDERASYVELKSAIQQIQADVGVVILDSCASGAFTRLKGGQQRPPVLVDESLSVQGMAVLTSSSAEEGAQESERLRGSFFTHALVAGLRGAGDTSHDGRVTLTEAYQYAFADTLTRTERTSGGPQHAAFDIRLSGTGDLVMSDLRDTSSTLVIEGALSGRIFVRDAGRLVAEVTKLPGAPLALALPAARYDVTIQSSVAGTRTLRGTTVDLALGELRVTEAQLVDVDTERTVARGPTFEDAAPQAGKTSPGLFLVSTAAVAVGTVGALAFGTIATALHVESSTPDGNATQKQLALDIGPWLLAGAAGSAVLAAAGVVGFAMNSVEP